MSGDPVCGFCGSLAPMSCGCMYIIGPRYGDKYRPCNAPLPDELTRLRERVAELEASNASKHTVMLASARALAAAERDAARLNRLEWMMKNWRTQPLAIDVDGRTDQFIVTDSRESMLRQRDYERPSFSTIRSAIDAAMEPRSGGIPSDNLPKGDER